MSRLQVFSPFPIKSVEYEITALDYLDGYIYIGSISGVLSKQRVKYADIQGQFKNKIEIDGKETVVRTYKNTYIAKITCCQYIN